MSESKRTWIFPPTLKQVKLQFEALYRSLYKTADRRKPLMIIGDRGVGKSAFVDLFEDLYTADNRAKVKRLNIASLPENLLISELFGHKKGAFTDAKIDKPGHFKTLGDGGLLILEEVGDISPQIQAKLLTVIEDGEYYPIGATDKPERAKNIQIVGTTNKPRSAFREDFYDRFFPFRIPSIYQRREDILYYIAYFFPELLESLTGQEVLALLCYHWPGNVREIERCCNLIKWREKVFSDQVNELKKKDSFSEVGDFRPVTATMWYPREMTDRMSERIKRVSEQIENEFAKQALELTYKTADIMAITHEGFDLDLEASTKTWAEFPDYQYLEKLNDKLEDYRLMMFITFSKKNGFEIIGQTFDKNEKEYRLPGNLKNEVKAEKVIDAINRVISGFKLFCEMTGQYNRENRNLLLYEPKKESVPRNIIDIYSLKEDELLHDYYNNLLQATNWNVAEVARRADVGESNLRKRLKKWNIVRPSSL
jgi:DNA-binding NtrC family response regulator